MDRKYNDLIGDILKSADTKDTDQIEGFGKPLPKRCTEQDVFQNFQEKAKEAGYLPAWLRLQKDISRLIELVETDQDIKVINEKIKKYNTMCPPQMQKLPIRIDNIEHAKKIW